MLLAVLAAGAIALSGCSRPDPAARRETAPVPVATIVVGPGASAGSSLLGGRVRAREEATIRSALSARVTAIPVVDGASFHAGDELVRFTAIEAREALASAEARREAARVRLAEAQRQTARFDSLFVRGVVALRDRDLARQDFQAALAEQAAASAEAERLRAGTSVRAPFDGVVGRRLVEPGADVAAGQPLLEAYSNAGEEIAVALPESRAAALEAGRFDLQFADGGPFVAARVTRSEAMLDPATRTRTVYLRPERPARLSPGAFVRVRVGGASTTTIAVPPAAVVARGSLTGVFVIADGRAWLRWVRLGDPGGDAVEVLSGLDAGETIARSASGLADGMPVRTTP